MKGYPRVLYLMCLLATVVGPAQAQVVINEIVASSSNPEFFPAAIDYSQCAEFHDND